MNNNLQLIDKRGLTILLGAVTLITLISVIVIVLTVSLRNKEIARAEAERLRYEHQALANSTSFGMEDFYLDFRDPEAGTVYPARRPRRFWTDEEVDFYWIDPAEAGIDKLSSDNDAKILNSLGQTGGGP